MSKSLEKALYGGGEAEPYNGIFERYLQMDGLATGKELTEESVLKILDKYFNTRKIDSTILEQHRKYVDLMIEKEKKRIEDRVKEKIDLIFIDHREKSESYMQEGIKKLDEIKNNIIEEVNKKIEKVQNEFMEELRRI